MLTIDAVNTVLLGVPSSNQLNLCNSTAVFYNNVVDEPFSIPIRTPKPCFHYASTIQYFVPVYLGV